jgi:hypothetical protein
MGHVYNYVIFFFRRQNMAASSVTGVGQGSADKSGQKGSEHLFVGVEKLIGTRVWYSNTVTLTSTAQIVNLPEPLPGADTDYIVIGAVQSVHSTTVASASAGLTLPQGTLNVVSTTGFPGSGTIYVGTTDYTGSFGIQALAYTGTTSTTFTGVTGGTGLLSLGAVVSQGAAHAVGFGEVLPASEGSFVVYGTSGDTIGFAVVLLTGATVTTWPTANLG